MTTFDCLRCGRSTTVKYIQKSDGLCRECEGHPYPEPAPAIGNYCASPATTGRNMTVDLMLQASAGASSKIYTSNAWLDGFLGVGLPQNASLRDQFDHAKGSKARHGIETQRVLGGRAWAAVQTVIKGDF